MIEQPRAATLGEMQMRAGVEHHTPTIRVVDSLLLALHNRHDKGWWRRRSCRDAQRGLPKRVGIATATVVSDCERLTDVAVEQVYVRC